mgnify:CR=1 FL=1
MAAILWTVFGLLGGLLLAVVLVVGTPMRVRFVGSYDQKLDLSTEIRVFWGLSPRLRIPIRRQRPKRKKQPRPSSKRKGRPPRWTSFSTESAADLFASAGDTLRAMFGRIHVEACRLSVAFGLDDPADTGLVYGLITPAVYGLGSKRCRVSDEPDFSHRRFAGQAEVELRFTPVAVVWPAIRFGFRLWRRAK